MHVRLRCPVCGMLCFLKNIGKKHNLQAFLYNMKGRGNIVVTETEFQGPDQIEDYWIPILYDRLLDMGWKPPMHVSKVKLPMSIASVKTPMSVDKVKVPMQVKRVTYE